MNQNCEPEFKKFVGLHLEEGRPAEVLLKNVKIMKKPKLNMITCLDLIVKCILINNLSWKARTLWNLK